MVQCLLRLISIIIVLFVLLIIIIRLANTCKQRSTLFLIYEQYFSARNPILRWNLSGITVAGVTNVNGNASHLLNYPCYIAIDRSSTLYVTDRVNNRIQKFLKHQSIGKTVAGHADGTYGSSNYDLLNPAGLFVDSDENIYIGDSSNMRIQLWTKNALIGSTVAAGCGNLSMNSTCQLQSAYGLDYDPITEDIYVADRHAHQILRFQYNSSKGEIVAGGNGKGFKRNQLHNPYAVIFDRQTNSLLIANAGANNVVRWVVGAQEWHLVVGSRSGLTGKSSRLLQWPADIKVDSIGNLYVADRFNHRIQMFLVGQSQGITIAGITGESGSDSQHLNNPLSLAFDDQLNLYVADHENHRVQKFIRY